MSKVTKQQQAISHLENNNLSSAFSMIKSFKLGMSKAEKRIVEIAIEMQTPSKKSFYNGIGICYQDTCNQFCDIINRVFLRDSKKKMVFSKDQLSVQ
jgi:hypothetical protein